MKHGRILEGRLNNVRRIEHAVELWREKLHYLRVGNKEDEEYRNRQLLEFAALVCSGTPDKVCRSFI